MDKVTMCPRFWQVSMSEARKEQLWRAVSLTTLFGLSEQILDRSREGDPPVVNKTSRNAMGNTSTWSWLQ